MKREHSRGAFLGWLSSAEHCLDNVANSPKATESEKSDATIIRTSIQKLEMQIREKNDDNRKLK